VVGYVSVPEYENDSCDKLQWYDDRMREMNQE